MSRISRTPWDSEIPERRAKLERTLAQWDKKHQELLAPAIAAAGQEAQAKGGYAMKASAVEDDDEDDDNIEPDQDEDEAEEGEGVDSDDEQRDEEASGATPTQGERGKGKGRAAKPGAVRGRGRGKARGGTSARETKGTAPKAGAAAGSDVARAGSKRKRAAEEEGDDDTYVVLEEVVETGRQRKKKKRREQPHKPEKHSELWLEVNDRLKILLPSSCLPEVRVQPALRQAVDMEVELRRGEAAVALDELRRYLIASNLFRKHISNKKQRTGHTMRTRSKGTYITNTENINRAARKYRRAYHALLSLGVKDDPDFRRLRPTDVQAFNVEQAAQRVGDSKATTSGSWIWQKLDFVGEEELSKDWESYEEAGSSPHDCLRVAC